MPPKKTIVKPQITINITNNNNNIHNYFNRAPAPAPAAAVPVAESVGPAPIFATSSEKYHKVRRNKDKREVA